jgi:uncharacterized membrane protein
VILWQKVYCFANAAIYLLCAVLGLGFLVFRQSLADAETSATENAVVGALLLVVGLGLAALYGAGPFVPRRPWAWIYHIALIALTMTSCACLLFALPLLIFWIEPGVQAWFGRPTAMAGLPPLAPAPSGG